MVTTNSDKSRRLVVLFCKVESAVLYSTYAAQMAANHVSGKDNYLALLVEFR